MTTISSRRAPGARLGFLARRLRAEAAGRGSAAHRLGDLGERRAEDIVQDEDDAFGVSPGSTPSPDLRGAEDDDAVPPIDGVAEPGGLPGAVLEVRRPLVPSLRDVDGIAEVGFVDALPLHDVTLLGVDAPQVPERSCVGWLSPRDLGGSAVLLEIEVGDPDAAGERMIAHGAEVIVPIENRPYGKRSGRVRDPFGHLWIITGELR